MTNPNVSIVVPAKNESENLPALLQEISDACRDVPFEILVIDDGSDDDSITTLMQLKSEHTSLRVIRHETSGGQSAAVHSGVMKARANVICTLDGDGQNPPAELPKLFLPLIDANSNPKLGLVAGQRVGRQDTVSKKIASKLANRLRAAMLKDDTRDTGCGLKAFRRDAFFELPYFNHMHRYLPALFKRGGWDVAHVDVAHKAREAGVSKYSNLGRAWVGVSDLIGVAWLQRRAKKTTGRVNSAGGFGFSRR